jgi:hypothetical protein
MSIYHLHIPRTSGGYTRNIIKSAIDDRNSVTGHYRTISDDSFKQASFISGHYGTNPCKFADKTFAILRNPNELTFSYIKYLSLVQGGVQFDEDFLKRYLYEDNLRYSVTNVLSKFLTFEVDLEEYNKNIENHVTMANNCWFLKKDNVSVESVFSSISKNNITTFIYESENVHKKVFDFVGLDTVPQSSRVNQSFADQRDLYGKYFDEISAANDIDIVVYERMLW